MRNLLLLLLFIVISSGCAEDPSESDPGLDSDPGVRPPTSERASSDYRGEIFHTLARIQQPEAVDRPLQIGQPVSNAANGFTTVTTRYKAAPGFDELICLDPGSDTLWPGALLYGHSIVDGDYLPAVAGRTPVTISLSLVNISGSVVKTVTNPRLSSMRAAINNILAQHITGSTPARTSFSVSEVYNEDQLQLAVGGSFGTGVCSIKSQFDFSDKNIRSRSLVRFVQIYYTIDIDMPATPGSVFSSSNEAATVVKKCRGISPLYVSSVSYGRLALFSFESTEESEALKIAVSCAFSSLVNKGQISLTTSQQRLLKSCIIKATVIGGNGALAVHTINGLEGLKAFVLMGGNYDRDNPGAPLAYRLRYLSDNATCRIIFSSEYEVIRRFQHGSKFRVYEMTLHCDKENDAGDCEEFYGNLIIECINTNRNSAYQGFWHGEQATPHVWNLFSSGAWSLKEGRSRSISGGREFMVPIEDKEHTIIRVTGMLKECDTWGDDNLGTHSVSIPLENLQEGEYALSGFRCGRTRAHFEFRIRPL